VTAANPRLPGPTWHGRAGFIDGNGLPDAWEVRSSAPSIFSPDGDADGDGAPRTPSKQNGATDPFDPNSRPGLTLDRQGQRPPSSRGRSSPEKNEATLQLDQPVSLERNIPAATSISGGSFLSPCSPHHFLPQQPARIYYRVTANDLDSDGDLA